MAAEMSLCPDNELNRDSGRFNEHPEDLCRHWAVKPTAVSATSKFCTALARRLPIGTALRQSSVYWILVERTMASTAEVLEPEALQLPAADRARLVERLIASLDRNLSILSTYCWSIHAFDPSGSTASVVSS